jgi:hypothetical protein
VLTAGGSGEAHPTLAVCPDTTGFVLTQCPDGGQVFIAWQRNTSGDYTNPAMRLFYRTWTPAGGWAAEQAMASSATDVQDITPSADYRNAKPVVVWVRYLGTSLSDLASRRLAYRVIGDGAAKVASELPDGVSAPSLIARADLSETGNPDLQVAFTRADDGKGFISTRHALHVAKASSCFLGTCTFTWQKALDGSGRAIYGEKPRLVRSRNGERQIVMRAFHFGAADGKRAVLPGDPLGTALISGDLINVNANFTTGRARFAAITADGGSHFGHAAAYDPASESVVALSSLYVPPMTPQLKAAMKSLGPQAQLAFGKSVAVDGSVEMSAIPASVDLVLEEIATPTTQLVGGQPISVMVTVGNRGRRYQASEDGPAKLVLRWDSPTGVGTPFGSQDLSTIAGGGSTISFSISPFRRASRTTRCTCCTPPSSWTRR